MEDNLAEAKRTVKKNYKQKNEHATRSGFTRITKIRKQIERFELIHTMCCNMLDHVREQTMVTETHAVLNEFVHVHEEMIQNNKMDKLVSQYQELHDNVSNIRSDLGYIGSTMAESSVDEAYTDEDFEQQLKDFLAEDEGEPATAEKPATTPAPVSATVDAPVAATADAPVAATMDAPVAATMDAPVKTGETRLLRVESKALEVESKVFNENSRVAVSNNE